MRYERVAATFDITNKCSQRCRFCFNKGQLEMARQGLIPEEMSLDEIKDNYEHARKTHDFSIAILSGGEPTEHSRFWEVMDYFYYEKGSEVSSYLNTNALMFAEKANAFRLRDVLAGAQNGGMCVSISDIERQKLTEREKTRLLGIGNAVHAAMLSGKTITAVFVITKQNLNNLEKATDFLLDVLDRYPDKWQFNLHVRMPYMGQFMRNVHWGCMVESFRVVRPVLERTISKMAGHGIALRFLNIPLCQLRVDESAKLVKLPEDYRIRISSFQSMEKQWGRIFLEDSLHNPECKGCSLRDKCNMVQRGYIEKGIIPALRPQ